MILRVLRARVKVGEEAHLLRYVRDEAVAQALKIPGLLSCQPAIRSTPAGVELVLVSTWVGFDDLLASGRDLNAPAALPDTAPMLAESSAEHFELVIGDARALPIHSAKLRLARVSILPNHEAAYYEAVRRWSDRLLDAETGLVAFTLGRRVTDRRDEVVTVQVWEDDAAVRQAVGSDVERPIGREELGQFWAADPTVEQFDALMATDSRPDAPAILLADDQRRYVYATPAAARLSGRSLARLLTMRVEDIAHAQDRAGVAETWSQFVSEGSMRGPFVLERPDGTEVEVLYAARANTPWPGAHASVLIPPGDDTELDIDRALVDAGLVARYAVAASG